MAIPVAVTNGAQDFVFADLPKAVTIDGSASSDPDGSPITAYAWTWVGKPTTSTASLADATAAVTTFTADVPGTYLLMLEVTSGGESSDTDPDTAPASAYARITFTTEHRALHLPATGERDYGDRVNGNFEEFDALAGELDGHTTGGGHWTQDVDGNLSAPKNVTAGLDIVGIHSFGIARVQTIVNPFGEIAGLMVVFGHKDAIDAGYPALTQSQQGVTIIQAAAAATVSLAVGANIPLIAHETGVAIQNGSDSLANANAILEVSGTTGGFLPPRLTTAQRDAIVVGAQDAGLLIWNTDNGRIEVYDGATWRGLAFV